MNQDITEKSKRHFLDLFCKKDGRYEYLPQHVFEAEKWSKKLLEHFPQADKEIVSLSVWLHDIGQTVADFKYGDDHAVFSEREVRSFLKGLVSQETIEKVAHCVRSHRCKDIQPESIEAKIIAVADSVSHMTDINYIIHLKDKPKAWVLDKLERDYRDTGIFPKFQEEITSLYNSWKQLLINFPD